MERLPLATILYSGRPHPTDSVSDIVLLKGGVFLASTRAKRAVASGASAVPSLTKNDDPVEACAARLLSHSPHSGKF